ncbi:MAG: hypothetical protein ACI4U6_04750 [Acutalibacteraceae bacterium]
MEKRSNTDNAKLNETLNKIADGKLSKNTIEAAKKGDTNAVMQSLNESDRKKMKEILSDNEKIKNILNSDAAKNIMKILGGDKKNG